MNNKCYNKRLDKNIYITFFNKEDLSDTLLIRGNVMMHYNSYEIFNYFYINKINALLINTRLTCILHSQYLSSINRPLKDWIIREYESSI